MSVKTPIKRRSFVYVAIVLIIFVFAVAGMSRHAWNTLADTSAKAENASNSGSARRRIEGEVIVLRPYGFYPREIRRRAGPPFLLSVENQSSLPVSSLTIKSSVGLPIRNTLMPREQPMWGDLLNLPPGTYTLVEANHSDWICTIIVESDR